MKAYALYLSLTLALLAQPAAAARRRAHHPHRRNRSIQAARPPVGVGTRSPAASTSGDGVYTRVGRGAADPEAILTYQRQREAVLLREIAHAYGEPTGSAAGNAGSDASSAQADTARQEERQNQARRSQERRDEDSRQEQATIERRQQERREEDRRAEDRRQEQRREDQRAEDRRRENH